MHSLKPITLDLKPAVDRLFEIENSRSADFCFGNVYMWDKRFKQRSFGMIFASPVSTDCGLTLTAAA